MQRLSLVGDSAQGGLYDGRELQQKRKEGLSETESGKRFSPRQSVTKKSSLLDVKREERYSWEREEVLT